MEWKCAGLFIDRSIEDCMDLFIVDQGFGGHGGSGVVGTC